MVDLGYEGRCGVILLVHNKISNNTDFRMMPGVFTKPQAFLFLNLVTLGARGEVGKCRGCSREEDSSKTLFHSWFPEATK